MKLTRALVWLGLVAAVVSCADRPLAPVVDKTGRAPRTLPEERSSSSGPVSTVTLRAGKPYTVQRGDTLYSIAFRLGMDFRALAGRNALRAPYTIYPGQVLATDLRPVNTTVSNTASTPAPVSAPKPNSSVAKTTVPASRPKPAAPQKRPQSVTKPSSVAAKKEPTRATPVANTPVGRWRWPSEGQVVQRYASHPRKGIDVAGERGSAIRATAAGNVVYAGTGVTGYGALIIVKHNEEYLSAYGHNDELLVREGDRVQAGQQIARMGSSGTDKVKLHFQIRRRGKPVDPQKLLPSR